MPLPSRRPRSPEHREAVRMAWKACHIPFGTIVIALLILACVLSAILQVTALGR
jgi:hypothetical protein